MITNTTIDTASGDVTLDHVAGTLRAKGASADIRAARVDGAATVDTASGDVALGQTGAEVIALAWACPASPE